MSMKEDRDDNKQPTPSVIRSRYARLMGLHTTIETEHKEDTNRTQSVHKVKDQLDTNRTQTGHAKDVKNKNRTQNRTHDQTQTGYKPDTNRIQTGHNINVQGEAFTFSSYIGLQREILLLFYHDCKATRSSITQEISLQHIANTLKIRLGSVKTSIRRLQIKNAIKRANYKNGRSGWTKYELHEDIYREIMKYETGHKLSTKWTQTEHKVDTKPDTKPDTTLTSSSSYIYNKTTTTGETAEILPPEWEEIDLAELHKRNIRFGREHLLQVFFFLSKYSALDFQESIDGFVYDFDNGKTPQFRIGPLNFLLGIYKAGNLYISENYMSPEKKLILEMAERAEKKQREMEEANFSLWLDAQDLTALEHKLPPDVRIDFKVKGQRWKDWVKQNIYLKEKLTGH